MLLVFLKEPHIITHIMYATNISYKQLSSYLNFLVKLGLVEKFEFQKNQYKFRILENGLAFLCLLRLESTDARQIVFSLE